MVTQPPPAVPGKDVQEQPLPEPKAVQKVTSKISAKVKTKKNVSGSVIDIGLNAKSRKNKPEVRGKTNTDTVTKVDRSVLLTKPDTLTKIDGSV